MSAHTHRWHALTSLIQAGNTSVIDASNLGINSTKVKTMFRLLEDTESSKSGAGDPNDVETLSLSRNTLSISGTVQLAKQLKRLAVLFTGLRVLEIASNNIRCDGVKALCDAVPPVCAASLERLNLG